MSNEEELFDDEFYMMVLVDDEGGEHEFQLLVELEIEGETYRVLMPLSEEEEHEEELDMVFEAWQELEDSLEI